MAAIAGLISTFVGISPLGGSYSGYSGDGGPASSAELSSPEGGTVDSSGNQYIIDSGNQVVRMIPKNSGTYFGITMTGGNIYTIAGTAQTSGYTGDGAIATSATFNHPKGIAVDSIGNLYIADSGNYAIRMIPAVDGTYFGIPMSANFIYTIAGTGSTGIALEGALATTQPMDNMNAIAVDSQGGVYISDASTNQIRMIPQVSGTYFGIFIASGHIDWIVGDGTASYSGDGAAASAAELSGPGGVALDSSDNLYIVDSGNYVVRFVPVNSGTYFGVMMTGGNIYTIAGNGTAGYSGDGAAATSGELGSPSALAVDSLGNLYIANNDFVIRMVPSVSGSYFGVAMTAGNIYTIAGMDSSAIGNSEDGQAATASLTGKQYGLMADPTAPGLVYIVDYSFSLIRKVSSTGVMTTDAGINSYAGDSGPAAESRLYVPGQVYIDSSDNLFISDVYNYVVRMVPKQSGTHFGIAMTAGNIYTIAGSGRQTFAGMNGPALDAAISPEGLVVDSAGNLYISDSVNEVIEMVPQISGTYFGIPMTANSIYVIAGVAGVAGTGGDGGVATSADLQSPEGLALDSHGNLYIADNGNSAIRLLSNVTGGGRTAGHLYTIAGILATSGNTVNNAVATSANLSSPIGVILDSQDNLYIADTANFVVDMVPAVSGTYFGVTTVAGGLYIIAGVSGSSGYSASGTPSSSGTLTSVTGIALDHLGNLYLSMDDDSVIQIIPAVSGTYLGVDMIANQIYTVAGTSADPDYTGDNGQATLATLSSNIYSLALDSSGNLYFADGGNNVIREISH